MDAHGALHHIICRGIEHKNIFQDNADRENFIDSDFVESVLERQNEQF